MNLTRYWVVCMMVLFSTHLLVADEVDEASKPFIHPGLLHTTEELAFVKERISNAEEPWKSAWDRLRASSPASLEHVPVPYAKVVRGPYNNPNIGSSEMASDASAAYTHALQWCLTGEKAHSEKAIEILNAWSSTLEVVSGHDTKLLIGMMGVKFCNAAELIRHTDAGWLPADQDKFERMLREIFYPAIQDFYPTANGNWDASMIQTMIAMGVFLDDREMFDRAVDYYLHGEGNGAVRNYFNEFGECQESGRDQAHTQMGIGFLGCACEMAWKQGVDLYGAYDNRLALGFEYTARYNLGEDVPYEPYHSVDGRYHYRRISSDSRGRFSPIYDRVVYHYRDRVGLDMPYSERAALKTRTKDRSGAHVGWGNLMFVGLP
ncbi:alginate lyase family protein [Aporhodopirellula aestuarii]|uniref:Alginate lyase family protein n=1 Tax=Aporhodopirellula aestuarii TaxID=2950107 RepID=A0ABT0UDY4_9BACT|nr:alginate lyase family protein [Aporhodopirellula aestuarii]MCM2374501.1 alginate lyase family protein [Aporhodopirellula aestuarii]